MNDPLSSWTFVPLYGLKIADDDGLEQPLFGDATLVSADWYAEEVARRAVTGRVVEAMTHTGLSSLVPEGAERKLGMPIEHLLELRPPAYIAVRRQNEEQATFYAESIRALLTATMFLRANRTTGFALSPADVVWMMKPRVARVLADGRPQVGSTVRFNERIWVNPLSVVKNDLRRSYETGHQIGIGREGLWDIHRKHPVCQLLVGKSRGTRRRKRMRSLAIHLAHTCCIPHPMGQIQMAITAMELAFGTNDFSHLQAIAFSFLPRSEERSLFKKITKARHDFVHEGKLLNHEDAQRLAAMAIMTAYLFFDISVGYLGRYDTTEKYAELLDAQVHAQSLAASIESLHGPDARRSFEAETQQPLHPWPVQRTARAKGE